LLENSPGCQKLPQKGAIPPEKAICKEPKVSRLQQRACTLLYRKEASCMRRAKKAKLQDEARSTTLIARRNVFRRKQYLGSAYSASTVFKFTSSILFGGHLRAVVQGTTPFLCAYLQNNSSWTTGEPARWNGAERSSSTFSINIPSGSRLASLTLTERSLRWFCMCFETDTKIFASPRQSCQNRDV
jgi:hypothetical protein